MAKKSKFKRRKNQRRMFEAMCAAMPNNGAIGEDGGFLRGFSDFLPSRKSERFLLGLLIGAGLAYVLNDEKLRGNIIKSAMKLYSGIAGNFEEIKEQIADYKAELEAAQFDEE